MPPDPRIRPFLDDPPAYGEDATLFTVELHHNGFFCGLHENLDYVSASVEHWDYCCTDTWSVRWIDELLKQMDYEKDGRMRVYWSPPWYKDISEGLICIEKDADILAMVNAVSKEERTQVLFVDHTNFLNRLRDDVIINGGPPLPAVISPKKMPRKRTPMAIVVDECEGIAGPAETFEDFVRVEDGSDDNDSEWIDSDYEAADGDDDLFAQNVDKEVKDNNEKEDEVEDLEDDAILEDGDLNFREEVQENLHKKFSAFNAEVDMNNPEFKVGMVFADVKEFRKALQNYSIRNRRKVNKIRNDPKRVEAVCKPKCTWRLNASTDSRNGAFTVKMYVQKHTCRRNWEVKALTANFLCDQFINEFRDNRKMDLKSFAAKVQREFKMCPNRWKLGRARKEALLRIHGDEASQFSLLWDYGQELRRSNPGSKFFLSTNKAKDSTDPVPKEHLATLYWSYDACKRGFLEGCRPFICVDGCHVKTKFKGQLLTAVGIDPNDCIYPIAVGLVEVECTSSWEWFLTTLRDDLNITNTSPWTIMSDKQKGLINAVQKVFPDAEHRFCVRHLHQNFQRAGHKGEGLKNDMWAIARSTNMVKYHQNMDNLKADSATAFDWIEELVPNTWIKAFFSDFPKCDMLLNNHCEVFNSYILDAREMPMLSMLEVMFYKIVQRIQSKQKEADKWTGTICPKIRKKLDKFIDWSNNCEVVSAGGGEYLVSSRETKYSVNLKTKSCDCRRWQLSGIPCHHVLACCRTDNIDPESLVHSCYSIETHKRAYAHNLHPLRGREFWEKVNGVLVHPPLYTKVMGRPKKNRKKSPEEKIKKGAPTLSRHGLTMHCSTCGGADHNKRGHAAYMLRLQNEQQGNDNLEQQENDNQQDEDDPTILQHIFPQNPLPLLDPTHQTNSMIYRMGLEKRAQAPTRNVEIPLPEESAFVVAARDSIPEPRARVTTATTRGRTTTTRGRRGRGRSNNTTSTARNTEQNGTDSTRRRSYSTAPGSMHHLLFGPVQPPRQQQVQPELPDLNADPPE